jgi:uncharacterized membrane protein
MRYWIIIALVFVAIGFFIFNNTGNFAKADDYVKIPVDEINENVNFYEFDSNGVKIRFLAVKSSDGSIKTAFDACDVCYKSKNGYRQEGDYLVCNNCGRRFKIDSLGRENASPGGCWPGYLSSKVENGFLLVKRKDLINGRWRFE